MALLTLSGVAKSYDPKRPLIEDASLVVAEDDRIGLIGPNGAGKSTLLRLLAGLEAPDAGARVARRGLRIGYLEQEPRFEPDRSVREIVHGGLEGRGELLDDLDEVYRELAEPGLAPARLVALGARQERLQHRLDELGGHTVEHRVEAAIHGVGLPDPEAQCGTLSGGEARRTALARLLVAEPELLLLDEPTNHLDAFVVAWLERQLAALAAPLVLVTHDRYLLDRVTSRIVEIDRGRLLAYEGGYRRYLELRAARLEGEAKTESARLNLLRRETAWIRRGAPARSTKARARIDRYEKLVEAAPPPAPEDLELAFPPGPRLGSKVVELRGVSHRYGTREVLPPLDLKLEPGMRLGVVGPNGAGKTTLLRILLGRLAPASGEVVIGETVRFATIDQKREDLDPRRSVLEEIAGRNDHVTIGGRAIHVVGFLDRFLFPGTRKEVAVGSLSGGERGRVLLAKLLLAGGNLLVLDEPTNDLDLGTLRALEEALCAFAGAVVVVSHDRWFLDRVATHVLWLNGCGGARLHTGDLSSLIERREREEAAMAAAAPRAEENVSSLPAGKPATAAPERRRLTQRERREMEEAFAAVAAREQEIAAIDAALADPALYQGDPARVRELHGRRAEAEDELAAAMARWEELAGRDGS